MEGRKEETEGRERETSDFMGEAAKEKEAHEAGVRLGVCVPRLGAAAVRTVPVLSEAPTLDRYHSLTHGTATDVSNSDITKDLP